MRPYVQWRKSTASGGEGSQCVELGSDSRGGLLLRDSKAPAEELVIDWRPLVAWATRTTRPS